MRRREWKLFWWTLPAVVLALLAAVALVGLWTLGLLAARDWEAGEHTAAASSYRWQRTLSQGGPERWKAPSNQGATSLALGDPAAAAEQLETALALVPRARPEASGALPPGSPECRVRINLSLAYEGLGDQAATAGDAAAGRDLLTKALDTIGPCSSDGQSEVGQQPEEPHSPPDETEQRQNRKQQEQGAGPEEPPPAGQPGQQGSTPSPSPSPSPSGDARVQQLQERNRQAEEEAEQRQQGEGGGAGGGQNW